MAEEKRIKLEPGTIVSGQSLVVDKDGVVWWIDPENEVYSEVYPDPEEETDAEA
jgi:hypothetical protein